MESPRFIIKNAGTLGLNHRKCWKNAEEMFDWIGMDGFEGKCTGNPWDSTPSRGLDIFSSNFRINTTGLQARKSGR